MYQPFLLKIYSIELPFAVDRTGSLTNFMVLIILAEIFSNYSKVDWKGGCDMVQCITWCMELSRLSRLEDTDLLIDDDRSEHSIR